MTASTHVFSAFSFLGFILCCIPLYWHLEAWNVGTVAYMTWTGLACLMYFVNSIVWDGNAINWAPVWCDISSRFIIGVVVAIPAASLCINRRLYHIACPTSAMQTKAEKRRNIIVDISICVGIPVLQMILQYIVSGHRFNIFEDIGCFPATYNVTLAYPLVFAWPLVLGLISAVYCVLTILAFMKRRKQFQDLMSRNRNLTYSRYFRLMLLAGIDLCCTVPLSIYSIYLNTAADPAGVQPWISLSETHYNYSRVIQYPRVLYSQNQDSLVSLELSRWMMVVCAILFFGFFGFADEAKKNYRIAFTSVAKSVGYSTIDSFGSPSSATFSGKFSAYGKESKGSSSFSKPRVHLDLPVYVTKETEVSRDTDTVSSFSDKLSTSIYLGEATMGDLTLTQNEPYSPTDTSPTISRYTPSPTPSENRELRFPEPALDVSSIRRPSVPEDVV